MTGCLPSSGGRNTSARRTSPSSIVIGTSQSIRIPSRTSLSSSAIAPTLYHRRRAGTSRRTGLQWPRRREGANDAAEVRDRPLRDEGPDLLHHPEPTAESE